MKKLIAGLAGLAALAGMAATDVPALAQQGTPTAKELRAQFDKDVQGKTIAYLPIALGVPLSDEWGHVMQQEAAQYGMKFEFRDPNNNPSAMQDALTALVNSHPDVIVVQNPSVTLLMRELRKAEQQGTHVVQMNMSTNYKSDAFVGADWFQVGQMIAKDVVKECGTGSGKSGKVQIIQGELTAAASVDQIAGVMSVFSKDKAIKVVSNQAANWDANQALNITNTVLQQNPDLCASVGFWGIMESGAAQAIRNAGKLGQVKVYASGEGSQLDCDQLQSGNFYKLLSYDAAMQGRDAMDAIMMVLESGRKAGAEHREVYTPLKWLTKENAKGGNCFPLVKLQ